MPGSYSIIPDDRKMETEVDISSVRTAVLVHLFYEDQVEWSKKYLEELPDCIDIIIFSSKDDILDQFQDDRYRRIRKENRGRDISALLVAARAVIFHYQYICFVHDKREKNPDDKEYVDLWRKSMWDNTLRSSVYVSNILDMFESEGRIGLMVPPPPHQGDRGVWLKGDWGGTFELVRNLANEIGLSADIRYETPPITYSTVFWARTKVLRKLFSKEWSYTDFPDEPMRDYGEINHAVERILQYVATDAGYETKILFSVASASEFILQLRSEMKGLWGRIQDCFGIRNYWDFDNYLQRTEKIKYFAACHSKLYLYGAGMAGRDCMRMCAVQGIVPKGILVTDVEDAYGDMDGTRILPVSELDLSEGTGIIITVYEADYQNEIKKRLDDMGFCEYITY